MRSLLGRFRRPISRSQLEKIGTMVLDGDGSTLSLDFTAMSSLDSRFTYTRNSIATFINSSGLVQQVTAAATNDPTKARFDYNPTTLAPRGLLIEGSATNLVKYSQELNQVSGVNQWYAVNFNTPTVPASPPTDPFGGTSASWKLVATAGSAFHLWRFSAAFTAENYTFSFWAKAAEYDRITLGDPGAGRGGCSFVLTGNGSTVVRAGTVTPTNPRITPYQNGWYRCEVTMLMTAATYGFGIGGYPSATTPSEYGPNYNADGTSGVFATGFQVETGSGASSYIPTGASQVQRAADLCEITGTNFSSWWPANQSEFTMLWTGDITRSPATTQFLWLNRNSGGTSRSRGYVNTSSVIRANAVSSYDFTASPATNATVNTVFNHALAVKTGDSAMYVNSGTTIGSDTTTTAPPGANFDADKIIFNPNADNFMHMRTLKFWPQRLPNATLNGLVT